MAVDLDLALSPSSMFSKMKAEVVTQLVQKPNDTFFIIPAKNYYKAAIDAVDSAKIPPLYKKYLSNLLRYANGEKIDLKESFSGSKEINFNEVQKYFGEILGPLNIIKTMRNAESIIFPVRTNYQLFDFFVKSGNTYVGYSSKAGGSTSNTLTPTVISERIKKSKQRFTDKEMMFGRDVMVTLGEASIVDGLVKVVGLMVKAKKFPKAMDRKMISALSSIDWEGSASVMQQNKTQPISKMKIKNSSNIDYFMSNYVLPRTKLDNKIKNAYTTGKKEYTGNNVAYGLGMLIVDANKEGTLDCSPFLRTLFEDLNLIKMNLTSAVPSFKVVNLTDYTDAKFLFRSKYRWDVIKDKLGIQL
jgi:hypothetical protein